MAESRGTRNGTLALPARPASTAPAGAWEISAEAPGFTAAKLRISDR